MLVWLGVKVTLMVQVPFEATVPPQVLVWAKSALLAPMIVMLLKLRAAAPELVTETTWGALVVPLAWLNESEGGARLIVVVAMTTSTQ